jgi:hypothetical protein
MPFNGSGVFQRVRNWVQDAAAGIKIKADLHDSEDDNFAAGISNCITRDGQSLITQNIPFNSKRITGLADAINPQDAVTKSYADTKLAAGGGSMTGDITISSINPALWLNSVPGGSSNINGTEGGKQRWLMRLGNDSPETGSNAGSDFDLHRYADDGTYLGQSLLINRINGAMAFGTWGTMSSVGLNMSVGKIATPGAVEALSVTTSGSIFCYGIVYALGGNLVSRSNGGTAGIQLQKSDASVAAEWYWDPVDNSVTFWNRAAPVSISCAADGKVKLANGIQSKAGFSGGYGTVCYNLNWTGSGFDLYADDQRQGRIAYTGAITALEEDLQAKIDALQARIEALEAKGT